MRKITLLIGMIALMATSSMAQCPGSVTVNIPDTNFLNALLLHSGLDANSDSIIQCSEALAFTGDINVGGKSISDLTGIEAFENITALYCSNNNLTTLNISALTLLTDFDCATNQLTALDVSSNTALVNFSCGDNLLTSIDVTSLTSLNVLLCRHNQITSLDVLSNLSLVGLYCNNNLLTNLNVSGLTSLERINCAVNQLTNLDFSTNTAITKLSCDYNSLISLNVNNGNNINIIGSDFYATNNPDLTCIQVDDAVWSTANWPHIDSVASYNEDCNYCLVNIPDPLFKAELLNISGLDADADGEIDCSEAAAYTGVINVANKTISNIIGIEAFTSITHLDCHNNYISTLDVSNNTLLTYLDCSENGTNALDVTADTALTYLNCSANYISALDATANTALKNLYCNDNLLSSLNVSGLDSLTTIFCYNNQLTSLVVSTNMVLNDLRCNNNLLTSLNVAGLTSLFRIECSANQLVNLDVSSVISLQYLYCNDNLLTNLNISGLTTINELLCNNNQLTSLDVSPNISLSTIGCNNNLLSGLNVQNGNNTNFNSFDATNNPDLTCIQVDDAAWSTTNWTNIDAWASFSTICGLITVTELKENSLSIFPNPVIDELTISNIRENSTISICDLNGRLLINKIARSYTENIDVSRLANGVYSIKITDDNTTKIIKLIKQ